MYIDELIIINFIIDYILLLTLSKILKINVKNKKILLGALVGEISIFYLFLETNNYVLWIFKFIISILMIIVSFGYKNFRFFSNNMIYFYTLSFVLGGVLYYFKLESKLIKYKYFLLLIPIIMNIYKYLSYNLKNYFSLIYKVDIYLNSGKVLKLNGYMDTANTLNEPYSNKKVIIINKEVNEKFFLVPFETINERSFIKCFKPKRVYIEGFGDRKDVVVGVINKKFRGYDCLLNYNLMEETWKNYLKKY